MNEHFSGKNSPPSWSDPDAAMEFLVKLRPAGPWNLTAIVPDGSGPESATFTDPVKAREWIADRSGRANCYYMANAAPIPTGAAARAKKADVRTVDFQHIDIDTDLQGPIDGDPVRKQAVVARLRAMTQPGPPTIIIDTGGGVQALWERQDTATLDTSKADADRINEHLISLFSGDVGTWNYDHLLRLPGTVNLPNAKKRTRGRTPAPATIVEQNDRKYYSFEFGTAPARAEKVAVDVLIGGPEEVGDLDALAAQYGLPDHLLELIRTGQVQGKSMASRSEWLFSAVMQLVRRHVPNEIILGIILDDRFDISESVLEKPEDRRDAYAERQIRSALEKVATALSADFPDDLDAVDANTEAPRADALKKHRSIEFTPYVRRDPTTIPPREYLMEPAYIRKFTTGTLAHGAVGKSRLLMVEAVALASGLPLLGVEPRGRFRVVLWNGEDPVEELHRSVEAVCKHYDLPAEATDGYLMIDSGRNLPINIAVQDKTGTHIAVPEVDALINALRNSDADVLMIDPFVSCHSVQENDNAAVEKVAQAWNLVADTANVSVHLAHHSVKARDRDVGAMDYRGGGASLAKLRYLRVLNRMGAKEAANVGIDALKARLHIRIDDGEKSNLLPPGEDAIWLKLVSVDLQNADLRRDGIYAESDKVGVVTRWTYPDSKLWPTYDEIEAIFKMMGTEPWRKTSVSKDRWVGIPIAEALNVDLSDEAVKKAVRQQIESWVKSGVLVEAKPGESDANGNRREGYVPGKLPTDWTADE